MATNLDPTEPSAARRRYGFALLTYAFVAVMLGTTLPTPMYALYAEQMHFGVLTTTVIFATYAGGVLFALLAFGRWSDALGRRPVLLAGGVAAIASALVFLAAADVTALLVGRFLSGVSAGLFTGTATAAVIESAPPSWRPRAAAVATTANIGGLGLGPVLAGLLVQYAPAPLQLAFEVHIALVLLAIGAVAFAAETSRRQGRIGFQRLSVPAQTRAVFAVAATAGFAGFAVLGLFSAVAPSFVSGVIGIANHATAGLVVGTAFAGSAVAQLVAVRFRSSRALAVGCAVLLVGLLALALALWSASLPLLVVAALLLGCGQGVSFGRGLAAVSDRTPVERRAEVNSTYFVVAYVAISLPVIGVGLAAQRWGLQTAGVSFALAVGVLTAVCLVAVVVQQRRESRAELRVGASER